MATRRCKPACQPPPNGSACGAGLAKRFATVNIILDHLARPDLTDGAPYHKSVQLFATAAFENIHLKITPPVSGLCFLLRVCEVHRRP